MLARGATGFSLIFVIPVDGDIKYKLNDFSSKYQAASKNFALN
jgi:hypothetical protein